MQNKNFIQLSNISKTYDDGYVAVKDINININNGEFVTLLGPSGCGKTTILKMLAGFELPTSGKIIVNNIDIKDLPINERPTATVFQDYALFPNMNIYQNITYGLKVMRKEISGITNQDFKDSEKVYREGIKKAANEIKKINNQQGKLLRQISKLNDLYKKYPEVESIKDMRELQYEMKEKSFLKKIKDKYGIDYHFYISRKNKNKEAFYKIR
jgi:spermidine/putrescine transport system ATP-binding protein